MDFKFAKMLADESAAPMAVLDFGPAYCPIKLPGRYGARPWHQGLQGVVALNAAAMKMGAKL